MRYLPVFIFVILHFSRLSAQTENYFVRKAPFSSSKFDEFSPVYYQGRVVYCSNRSTGVYSGYSTTRKTAFFKMYSADTTSGAAANYNIPVPGEVNSNLNNGPATFNKSGDTIYFSRNLIVEGSYKDVTGKNNKLGLFVAVLKDGKWTGVTEMRFNDNSWNVTTPALSPDSHRLYFASDRPEGHGGSDLYYSEWKNGFWDNPVNLGEVINTPGNEAYPFVNGNGELFFSSDGLPGKGGKDIFFTKQVDSMWITPVNLKSPVNTKYNDFGFIADDIMSKGYFSSDRSNQLDIYSFKTIFPQFLYCEEQQQQNFCINLSDDELIETDPILMEFTWDFGDGSAASGYTAQHCYSKPGRYTVKQNITEKNSRRVVFTKSISIAEIIDKKLPVINSGDILTTGKPASFNAELPGDGLSSVNYYWDFGKAGTEKGTKAVKVFDEPGEHTVKLLANIREPGNSSRQVCVEKRINVMPEGGQVENRLLGNTTDTSKQAKGNEIKLIPVYSLKNQLAKKAVFAVEILESDKKIPAGDAAFRSLQNYSIKRNTMDDTLKYSYVIDEEIDFMSAYYSYRKAIAAGMKNARIVTYVPPTEDETELWNFKRSYGTSSDDYFVQNGYSISQKSIPALDRLVLLLKRNPGLNILVEAHTSNGGPSAEKMIFTQRQAQNIVDYLVENGISGSRLIAKGYGSSRPIAPDYPESEKSKNRRIDFIKINQ
jgi:outer membrane protein OmpA-like peptidoglycan-associated protein